MSGGGLQGWAEDSRLARRGLQQRSTTSAGSSQASGYPDRKPFCLARKAVEACAPGCRGLLATPGVLCASKTGSRAGQKGLWSGLWGCALYAGAAQAAKSADSPFASRRSRKYASLGWLPSRLAPLLHGPSYPIVSGELDVVLRGSMQGGEHAHRAGRPGLCGECREEQQKKRLMDSPGDRRPDQTDTRSRPRVGDGLQCIHLAWPVRGGISMRTACWNSCGLSRKA